MDGIVVAPQPLAVEEGAKVLRAGGNAVDAAVTAAFVQGVIDPTNCGMGGWGVMHVRSARTGRSEVIEFYSVLPRSMPSDFFAGDVVGNPGMWNIFQVRGWANNIGYRSVGVPGTVRGLAEGLARFGTWPLSRVLEPAIRWADEGVDVDAELASRLGPQFEADDGGPKMVDRLSATPASAALYTRDGHPLRPGDHMTHAEAAQTMRRLAAKGADDYYTGEIGARIAEDFRANDGFLDAEDLRSYRTRTSAPIGIDYRGYRVETSRPPTGGITVLQALNILEGYDLAALRHNSADYVHIVTEALRAAFADRIRYVGDPLFVDVPQEMLLSKDHAAEWRGKIRMERRLELPHPESLVVAGAKGHTTHLCAVDAEGNVVSLLHTLAMNGSGVVTPGLGFLYNDSVVLYNPFPGYPNSMAGGKMRANGGSPTIVYKDGRPFLALGSPGGHGIISGVLQTILNVVEHGMTPTEAVSASRFHCEHGPLQVETRIPLGVREELARRGHKVQNTLNPFAYVSGAVQLARIDPVSGAATGGADPRRGGMVLRATDV